MASEGRTGFKVVLHLHSGQSVEAWDQRFEEADDVLAHISDPPKPHWSIIGDVCVFTQAIAAVELL
jgi:hypothetical protein